MTDKELQDSINRVEKNHQTLFTKGLLTAEYYATFRDTHGELVKLIKEMAERLKNG